MKLKLFAAPGNLTDFATVAARTAWSAYIAGIFEDCITSVENDVGANNSQFYNPTQTDTTAPSPTAVINWGGFPKQIERAFPGNKTKQYQEADKLGVLNGRLQRVNQDEYLEWFATTDAAGKITRVTFTCEGPEYWQELAKLQPDTVLSLYQSFISPNVKHADLFKNGSYDQANSWNTRQGAMHLTQSSNSLGAEIKLAADATVLRQKNGVVLTDPQALINCAQYGVSARASDPRIGSDVNTLARQGASITLADPVGLYIDSIDTTGWQRPDGGPVGDYWKVVRGSKDYTLRAVYEVPTNEGFSVDDITVNGQKLLYGGQIAEAITMKLTGLACRIGQSHVPAIGCVGGGAVGGSAIGEVKPKHKSNMPSRVHVG